ncbi:hypothetical protein AB6D66_18700 [Vibrio pomeroyi]|uniref:Uncharacterized protein n=1 Tax=Vibrio pomeroyi TaxID=198832 RepID=A0ABV4N141_9VIBR
MSEILNELQEVKKASQEQTAVSQAIANEVAGKMAAIDKKVDDAIEEVKSGEFDSVSFDSITLGIASFIGDANNTFAHLKTNIPRFQPYMVALNFSGYHYGTGVIDTDVSFYVYQSPDYSDKGILMGWVVRHKGLGEGESSPAQDLTYYFSQDDYLVLVFSGLNSYSKITASQLRGATNHIPVKVEECRHSQSVVEVF